MHGDALAQDVGSSLRKRTFMPAACPMRDSQDVHGESLISVEVSGAAMAVAICIGLPMLS